MNRFLSGLTIAATCFWAALAQAGSVVVVELYTSQGCSSCPPADDILTELAGRDDVIALGLHVNYWDYLGWRDDLALAAFTERQARFNAIMKSRYRLVTPQMIFNGRDYVAGAKRVKAIDYVNMLSDEPEKAELVVTRGTDAVNIRLSAIAGSSAPADLHVVRYVPEIIREIKRGENAGRTIRYTNVVTSWETIAEWDGASDLTLNHPLTGEGAVAVIVQTRNLGPVQAARKID